MGVHDLWKLLAPCGHRISLTTLSHRKLAIDVSIWLAQFLKAMPTSQPHLLGLLRRLCKLHFYHIYPVFVFDGPAPMLKKRTLEARRRVRDKQRESFERIAERILLEQLKMKSVKQLRQKLTKKIAGEREANSEQKQQDDNDDDTEVTIIDKQMPSPKSARQSSPGSRRSKSALSILNDVDAGVEAGADDDPDMQLLRELQATEDAASVRSIIDQWRMQKEFEELDEDERANGETSRSSVKPCHEFTDEEKTIDLCALSEEEDESAPLPFVDPLNYSLPASGELDSEVLASLPISLQYELLEQHRNHHHTLSMRKYAAVKDDMNAFSSMQMRAFLKGVQFNKEIEAKRNEMNAGHTRDGLSVRRLAGDAGKEYLYLKRDEKKEREERERAEKAKLDAEHRERAIKNHNNHYVHKHLVAIKQRELAEWRCEECGAPNENDGESESGVALCHQCGALRKQFHDRGTVNVLTGVVGDQLAQLASSNTATRSPLTVVKSETLPTSSSIDRTNYSRMSTTFVATASNEQPDYWLCEHCSFLNEPKYSKCEICEQQRPTTTRVPQRTSASPPIRMKKEEAIDVDGEHSPRTSFESLLLPADSLKAATKIRRPRMRVKKLDVNEIIWFDEESKAQTLAVGTSRSAVLSELEMGAMCDGESEEVVVRGSLKRVQKAEPAPLPISTAAAPVRLEVGFLEADESLDDESKYERDGVQEETSREQRDGQFQDEDENELQSAVQLSLAVEVAVPLLVKSATEHPTASARIAASSQLDTATMPIVIVDECATGLDSDDSLWEDDDTETVVHHGVFTADRVPLISVDTEALSQRPTMTVAVFESIAVVEEQRTQRPLAAMSEEEQTRLVPVAVLAAPQPVAADPHAIHISASVVAADREPRVKPVRLHPVKRIMREMDATTAIGRATASETPIPAAVPSSQPSATASTPPTALRPFSPPEQLVQRQNSSPSVIRSEAGRASAAEVSQAIPLALSAMPVHEENLLLRTAGSALAPSSAGTVRPLHEEVTLIEVDQVSATASMETETVLTAAETVSSASTAPIAVWSSATEDSSNFANSAEAKRLDTLYTESHALSSSLSMHRQKGERQNQHVTSSMIDECKHLLSLFGCPYVESPAEAEAQCAQLELLGLVDGVVTEDSDVFLFGASHVYRNIFEAKKFAERYKAAEVAAKLGLTRDQLISLALLLGSDYTLGVHGIGIVNAMEIVNAFPGPGNDGLRAFREWCYSGTTEKRPNIPVLEEEHVGETAEENAARDARNAAKVSDYRRCVFKFKHRNMRRAWHVSRDFPSDSVRRGYEEPLVDPSREPLTWSKPRWDDIIEFLHTKFRADSEERRVALGSAVADEPDEWVAMVQQLRVTWEEEEERARASGPYQQRIDLFFDEHDQFAEVRSKRISQAIRGLTVKQMHDDERATGKKQTAAKRKKKAGADSTTGTCSGPAAAGGGAEASGLTAEYANSAKVSVVIADDDHQGDGAKCSPPRARKELQRGGNGNIDAIHRDRDRRAMEDSEWIDDSAQLVEDEDGVSGDDDVEASTRPSRGKRARSSGTRSLSSVRSKRGRVRG